MTGKNKLLGAILLISGTAIGAGMIAQPIVTAEYGFFPTVVLFLITWLCTMLSGLMMLEVNLWLPSGSNLISMAEETLGPWGKFFSWLSYLLLLYALIMAYLTAMNATFVQLLDNYFHITLAQWQSATIIMFILSLFIFSGTKTIDYINRIFIIGLVVSFFGFIGSATPEINYSHLLFANYKGMWITFPIIVTAFGYQIVIPTLRRYLCDNISQLKIAIIVGSTIPLLVYIVWEMIVVGVIPPLGAYSLSWIKNTPHPNLGLTVALEHLLNKSYISTLASMLTFYVIATSILGVSLSLYDLFRDGLHTRKTRGGKFIALIPTFLPPLVFSLIYPEGFILALGYGGALVAILLLIMPALMTYSGRYLRKEKSQFTTPGGKLSIALVMAFGIAVIILQFMQ